MSPTTTEPPTNPPKLPDEVTPQDQTSHDTLARGPELDVRFTRRGSTIVVHLAGELDIYTVPGLRRQLDRHDHPGTSLVVDLSRVTLIDSSGLGLLVTLRNQRVDADRKIALVLDGSRLKSVLAIAGLTDAFVQAATVDDALAAIGDDRPET
jgi:anti-sigma B factor antagonist